MSEAERTALIARLENDAAGHDLEAERIESEARDLPRRVKRDADEERREAADIRAVIALFRDLTSVEVNVPLLARLNDLATSPTLHPSRALDLRAAVALIQAQARQIARDRERSDNDARFAAKSASA